MNKTFQRVPMTGILGKRLFLKVLLCLILSLVQLHSYSATTDSVKKKKPKIISKVKYIYEDALSHAHLDSQYQKVDTVLDGIEIFNPAFQQSYKYLDNLGTASEPNLFNIRNTLGIDLGYHQFDLFFFRPDSIKYYHTNTPFTEIDYEQGSKSEGYIRVLHTQNINDQWNVGLNYNRIGSDGTLYHQISSVTDFDFFTWYKSKNKRYNIIASYIINTEKNQENGGMNPGVPTIDSLSSIILNPSDVYLQNANTTYKNHIFNVKQFYDFGYKKNVKVNDTATIKEFVPTSRISHSFIYETNTYIYSDSLESPGFYNNYYYDSAATLDSSHYYKIENKVSWGTLENKNNGEDSIRKLLYQFDIAHEFVKYNQTHIDTSIQNAYIGGTIKLNSERNFTASGNYCFYGASRGVYTSALRIAIFDLPSSHLSFEISNNSIAPSILQSRYDGNNFYWNNNFSKTHSQAETIELFARKIKTKLDIRVMNISNYIYYDSLAMPQQSGDLIKLIQIDLTKNFHWSHLHFNNRFIYQKSLDNNVVHVPQFVTSNSLFYEMYLFKHILQTEIGSDFHYNTAYYGDAYMPVTGQFYVQNDTKIGNYPLVDLFLNIRIKTCRLFVRGENMLYTLNSNHNYALVPNYTMPGFTIKFGVLWQFFD